MSGFARWPVRQLELAAGIPALPAEPGIGGLHVVLWWHGLALGQLELRACSLPMSAAAVRDAVAVAIAPAVRAYLEDAERAGMGAAEPDGWQPDTLSRLARLTDPLARVAALARVPQRAGRRPSCSVVICTRDRPKPLARCLQSLAQLRDPPDEILVVDNAPSDARTRELVEHLPGVAYVQEPRPGLDCARNAGVRHSRGEIIAYVDDDVCVHPDWLAQLARGFDDPAVLAVTGLVLPAELETESQYLFEKFWSLNRGYGPRAFGPAHYRQTQPHGTPVWSIGAGANMAFRRSAFEALGGFDERLDAGAAGVAGDSEYWYRVLAAGGTCRYQPSAVVFHQHRRELAALKRQTFNYMRGHVAALLVQSARYGDRGNLYRLLRVLPDYYLRTALRARLPEHRLRATTLATEIAGCIAGLGYYARTRRAAQQAVPRFAVRAPVSAAERSSAAADSFDHPAEGL